MATRAPLKWFYDAEPDDVSCDCVRGGRFPELVRVFQTEWRTAAMAMSGQDTFVHRRAPPMSPVVSRCARHARTCV
jgi:hypothetical protein